MQILSHIIEYIPHASVIQFIGGELGGFITFLYQFYFVEPPSANHKPSVEPIIYLPLNIFFGGVMAFVAGSFILMSFSGLIQLSSAVVIGSVGKEVLGILQMKVLSFISRIHFE